MESSIREQIRKWLRQGQLGRVVYTCDLHLHAGNLPAEERANWLFWKAKAHMKAGVTGYGPAKSCLKEGIPLAKKSPHLKATLMATLSGLYLLTLDITAAEALLTQFRRLARSHPDKVLPLVPCVLFNIGMTYDGAHRAEAARACYTEAAQAIRTQGLDPSLGDPETFLGLVLHNLGGTELMLGNLEAARTAMDQANLLQPDDKYGHKKLSRHAEYYLASGDLRQAEYYITQALQHHQVDDVTRADIHYTWATVLLRSGLPSEAREKALTGLDYAVREAHYSAIHNFNQFLKGLAT